MINDEFANGLPTVYHEVVSKGICKFSQKKKEPKQPSTDAPSQDDASKE